ncbi:MAG TPA: hypothetical protein IAB58_04850 [Candidatus Pelethosoma merdigallinarum]|nr:hypothetical protein [Candidatus Pelethosoma merdigallinarum]
MWMVYDDGRTNPSAVSNANGVRPVIMIPPDVQITSGNGIFNSPYQI